MKKVMILMVACTMLCTSCFVNRTTIGYGPVGASLHDRTFSMVKQQYILFGLISLNHPVLAIPPMGVGYEIKSDFSFLDGVVTCITLGIYGERTVRILVNKEDEQAIKERTRQ